MAFSPNCWYHFAAGKSFTGKSSAGFALSSSVYLIVIFINAFPWKSRCIQFPSAVLFFLSVLFPHFFRNFLHKCKFCPLLIFGQLISDLTGCKSTLRTQAQTIQRNILCLLHQFLRSPLSGSRWEHTIVLFLPALSLNVGSVQNALLPFGSRFSRTCPQTVLACLHAYGSPLIT